jgi:hypothetical protein
LECSHADTDKYGRIVARPQNPSSWNILTFAGLSSVV